VDYTQHVQPVPAKSRLTVDWIWQRRVTHLVREAVTHLQSWILRVGDAELLAAGVASCWMRG
jgi:hypothetical protein